jgi:virginiamycin B lyase
MKPATQRARPYGIAIDSHGNPWVNLFGTNKLAKVDPGAMSIQEIELPEARARDRRIAITPDDKVWYTDYARGMLGVYDPATGKFSEWPAPSGARSRPYAMATDDRARIWIVETGPTPNQLAGFDPATGKFFSVTPIESGGGAVRHMVYDPATRSIWFGTDTNTLGRARIP